MSKLTYKELSAQCEEFRKLYVHWWEAAEKLKKEKDEIERKFVDAVNYSCPEKYVKIFKDHGIKSPEDLDRALDRLLKMDACVMLVRNTRHDLAALADILATGGRP